MRLELVFSFPDREFGRSAKSGDLYLPQRYFCHRISRIASARVTDRLDRAESRTRAGWTVAGRIPRAFLLGEAVV